MPQTTIFDSRVFGDSDQLDTIIRNSVTIEETETQFDSELFGYDDQFDTENGGVISVNDTLTRLQNLTQ